MKKFELRDRVFSILEKYPETRNCDALLVARYWMEYSGQKLLSFNLQKNGRQELVWTLPLESLPSVQPASTIERMRRIVQNEMGRFWPTDPKVARRRRMNMEKWKESMIALTPDTL